MAEIVLTEEDRAFIAQGLEDFDPEQHPVLRAELDKVEKELHKNIRDDVVEFMHRQIEVALLSGVLLRSSAQYLEDNRLGWFVDAFLSERHGDALGNSETRGQEQFNSVVWKLYGDEDNALRIAFAYLTYAAEGRGLGDEEQERKWFGHLTDPTEFSNLQQAARLRSRSNPPIGLPTSAGPSNTPHRTSRPPTGAV